MMHETKLDFFLGSLSPSGFCSYFRKALPSLTDGTAILLKGGPGCGKSTLLHKTADVLARQGETLHIIHCAADPDSLDAVLCPARALAAVDATPPHALEPEYPAAYEQVLCLYDALDAEALQDQRQRLAQLSAQYRLSTERATRYITAAGSLVQDSLRVAQCCTDTAKAKAFAKTLARRYLPAGQGPAREDVRLLSAVTPKGIVFYSETVRRIADTVVILDDEFGAAGKAMMAALREEALARGLSFITCWCPLAPCEKIDHLLFPSLGLAFVTSNPFHPVDLPGQRMLHASRFMNKDALKLRRKRLRFNKKAAFELLDQASAIQREAKAVHDELEQIYAEALDLDYLNDLSEAFLSRL